MVRLELMPFQCKDRPYTDKSDVLTTTLQWINTKIFQLKVILTSLQSYSAVN